MVVFTDPSGNMTSLVEFIQYTNSLVSIGETGLIGVAILIIVGFVSFLASKSYTFERASGYASFLTLITAIFLRFLELINDAVLFLVIVIFIGSLALLVRERSVEESGV